MCEPATIMMGLTIAQGVSSFVGGQQQASAQADAAIANNQAFYEQTKIKQTQINEEYANKEFERRKEGQRARAEAMTAAGESGALGFTADRLIADTFMQQGFDLVAMENNRNNAIKQTNAENKSSQARTQSAVNSAYSDAPGFIDTGLQVGGTIYRDQQLINKQSKD